MLTNNYSKNYGFTVSFSFHYTKNSKYSALTIIDSVLEEIDMTSFDAIFHKVSAELNSDDPSIKKAAQNFHVRNPIILLCLSFFHRPNYYLHTLYYQLTIQKE